MYTMIRRPFAPRFLTDPFVSDFFDEPSILRMRTDIRKTEDGYLLEAEIPGVEKKDISLKLDENVLTISADLNLENKEEDNHYLRKERVSGHMERSFNVEGIQQDAITADYHNGILVVKLPKVPEVKKEVKNITIGGEE